MDAILFGLLAIGSLAFLGPPLLSCTKDGADPKNLVIATVGAIVCIISV